MKNSVCQIHSDLGFYGWVERLHKPGYELSRALIEHWASEPLWLSDARTWFFVPPIQSQSQLAGVNSMNSNLHVFPVPQWRYRIGILKAAAVSEISYHCSGRGWISDECTIITTNRVFDVRLKCSRTQHAIEHWGLRPSPVPAWWSNRAGHSCSK